VLTVNVNGEVVTGFASVVKGRGDHNACIALVGSFEDFGRRRGISWTYDGSKKLLLISKVLRMSRCEAGVLVFALPYAFSRVDETNVSTLHGTHLDEDDRPAIRNLILRHDAKYRVHVVLPRVKVRRVGRAP
jgi:hypothetical protein